MSFFFIFSIIYSLYRYEIQIQIIYAPVYTIAHTHALQTILNKTKCLADAVESVKGCHIFETKIFIYMNYKISPLKRVFIFFNLRI